MTPLKTLTIICLLLGMTFPLNSPEAFIATRETFIAKREEYKRFYNNSNHVIIASTGRSGSTMLTEQLKKYIPSKNVIKTHLLPPNPRYTGKILFIFSNPDQAAESALYMSLHHKLFAKNHFNYGETVDHGWVEKIGGAFYQTEEDNLLSYDALGVYEHLKAWLYTQTEPASSKNAHILAIKYENLWDQATIEAIRKFLLTPKFRLPPKRTRGRDKEELNPLEISVRKRYNLGTKSNPRYAAYDEARILWEQAPPFQYLNILP